MTWLSMAGALCSCIDVTGKANSGWKLLLLLHDGNSFSSWLKISTQDTTSQGENIFPFQAFLYVCIVHTVEE